MSRVDSNETGIVIFHEDLLFAELLKDCLLKHLTDCNIACCNDVSEACRLAADGNADLILVDFDSQRQPTTQTVRELRRLGYDRRILALTSEQYCKRKITDLLSLRIEGLVEKRPPYTGLIAGIRHVLAGGLYYSAKLNAESTPITVAAEAEGGTPVPVLDDRKKAILQKVSMGYASKEIASELGLSPRTVEKIRLDLMQDLKLRNSAALVRWAIINAVI